MTKDQADPAAPVGGMRRHALPAALLLAAALGAGFLVRAAPSRTAPPVALPKPPQLKTVALQRGAIEQAVLADGKLQLHEYADVGAQIAGQIRDVQVMIGDEVKRDRLLLEITPTQPLQRLESNRAQLARLQAELADQRAQLDFAELQFNRQTQLKAENATREETFESSRMSLHSAAARVEAINAQIRQTESTISDDEEMRKHTQIRAPIAGTVVSLAARPGQMVSASQPSPALLRIADLSTLTVKAQVAEIDVPQLRKGMTAYFTTPAYPGKQWSGKLRQLIPVPAGASGEQGKQAFYNVLFEVGNPGQKLLSGMSTRVHFVVAQAHDAVLLPVGLLGRPDAGGNYSVRVVGADRRPGSRTVRIGLRNAQYAQVLSGLAAGEQVLLGQPPAPPSAAAGNAPASMPR
ncbi:MAG TPA: efflux RND transporter periplasmic adaptor subunit [Burkholderiaceae bacterium]|nr:efflux RND transporter periplasmic adaptor subunit [Burkholderiaceae bacterium]